MQNLKRYFTDNPSRQSQGEMALSSLGAIIGIGLVAWVSHHLVGAAAFPYIVASMGAAAVLLYAAPHSPLTSPWAFVGGHLISAIIGVSCAQWIPDLYLASGLAVGLAIFAMHQLNCLHPPGGAAALVAVIGGEQIHALGYLYVVVPVGLNVLILGLVVWLTRALLAHRRKARTFVIDHDVSEPWAALHASAFSHADLKQAVQQIDSYIDVSIDDLHDIYRRATAIAHKRTLGDLLCRDLMMQPVVAVEFGDSLIDAWSLMQQHRIKSLPVINRARRVSGILTLSDLQMEAAKYAGATLAERLKLLLTPAAGLSSDKPEVAGQLMRAAVICLPEEAPASQAVSILSEQGISHLPIVDDEQRISGMLSRSDLARLLTQASPE